MTVPIAEIKIGKRCRRDLGDIEGLAKSIEELGLLHPIVLAPDNTLIVGLRRVEACRSLGWEAIPATVASSLDGFDRLLKAQCEENTCRKALTPEEAVAMGRLIEAAYRPKARAAQRAGGGDKRSVQTRPLGVSCPKRSRDESARTTAVAARAVGMSRRTYEQAREVVDSGERALLDEMNKTGRVSGAYRKLRVKRQADEIAKEPPPLPEGPFRVIVADAPWPYAKRADDPTHRGTIPYPAMSLEQIKAMNVGNMAHADAVLWLWTTNAFLPDAFEVARAWGFSYKTTLTWVKRKMGTGDWLRGQTEHCLLCVRGRPTIRLTSQTTVLVARGGRHSAKPEEFFHLVEALCPGSKVELFSRKKRPGWAVFGNDIQEDT